MYNTTKVTDLSEESLVCEEWVFILFGVIFYLDRYTLSRRPSKRHKFKIEALHSRTNPRLTHIPS